MDDDGKLTMFNPISLLRYRRDRRRLPSDIPRVCLLSRRNIP